MSNSKSRNLILLINSGSPDKANAVSVRRYLAEFLSDKRIIDLPSWKWKPILHGFILRTRPKHSAELYKKIWRKDGLSPLVYETKQQVKELQEKFPDFIVDYAMRYGNPSVEQKILSHITSGVEQILIIPMYPQYAQCTTASVLDAVSFAMRKTRNVPSWRFVRDWHDNPDYIDALATSYKQFEHKNGGVDRLILSFHGMPNLWYKQGDCYRDQVEKTASLLRDKLGFSAKKMPVVYQSRFGKQDWLKPYADEYLRKLGRDGVSRIAVMCPGFTVDCLETLEEIAIRNREEFISAGGKEYFYIPALNSTSLHIDVLVNIIKKHCADWI